MEYEYDLFVSYMHDGQMESWVEQHFTPFLRSFVGNAVGRPVSIFVDRNGIHSGDAWPERLRLALAKSRCLVAVWAPLYFHSEWCRRECAVMLRRQAGLAVPVNVDDGEHFPDAAKGIHAPVFHKYWIVGDGFPKTERYVEYQDALKAWCKDVAGALRAAPTWREEFLTAPWMDVDDSHLLPRSSVNHRFAGLE